VPGHPARWGRSDQHEWRGCRVTAAVSAIILTPSGQVGRDGRRASRGRARLLGPTTGALACSGREVGAEGYTLAMHQWKPGLCSAARAARGPKWTHLRRRDQGGVSGPLAGMHEAGYPPRTPTLSCWHGVRIRNTRRPGAASVNMHGGPAASPAESRRRTKEARSMHTTSLDP
jgi:hypothetical protein